MLKVGLRVHDDAHRGEVVTGTAAGLGVAPLLGTKGIRWRFSVAAESVCGEHQAG
jgi:hypothetical protein